MAEDSISFFSDEIVEKIFTEENWEKSLELFTKTGLTLSGQPNYIFIIVIARLIAAASNGDRQILTSLLSSIGGIAITIVTSEIETKKIN